MIGAVVASRYRVVARIGGGGGGEVYEAEDLELPRKVAIKFLNEDWGPDRRQRERFIREAEALSVLDHPHICTIHAAGETDRGRPYIVMARYEGLDLRARIAQGSLTLQEAISYGIGIADGLAYAHRKGLLHRDLKPGNVVITDERIVKILDFGLAKLPDRTQVTETGVAMGTLAYISPEQARGEKLDARTDIYSLGVILYQLVSGVCPFAASSVAATLQKVLNESPPPVREIARGVPARLGALIDAMMEKERERRPADMTVVHDELLAILGALEPTEAHRILAEHVVRPDLVPRRRARWPLVVAAGLVVVLLTNLGQIRDWVVGAGLPEGRGVAVLDVRADGFGGDRDFVAAGLQLDLVDQLEHLADHDDALWALPPYWPAGAEGTTPDRTAGVDFTLSASLRAGPGGPVLDLALDHADGSGQVARAQWSLADSVPDLQAWMAEALDLDDPPAWGGCTRDVGAWLAWLRGRGALGSRAPADALVAFDAALSADPGFTHAVLYRGAALAATGDVDSARAVLGGDFDVPDVRGAARGLLAPVEWAQGDVPRAISLLQEAVELRPGTFEYRMTLGYLHQVQNDHASAEAVYRDGIAARPGYPGVWEYLGWLHLSRKRYDEAIAAYEALLELAPDHASALNQLGAAYYATDRWEEAFAAFDRSFRLGRNFEACSNLGTIHYMRGEFARAAQMQEWALDFRPGHAGVVNNLAATLQWIEGEQARADSVLTEAIALTAGMHEQKPDDALIVAMLAALVSHRDPVRANELVWEALRLDPEDADVLYQAALACEETGDRTRALTLLSKAIRAGYSRRVIENEKQLERLRTDSRYGSYIQ